MLMHCSASWKRRYNKLQLVQVTSRHHIPLVVQQFQAVVDASTGLGQGPEGQSLVPTNTCWLLIWAKTWAHQIAPPTI